MWYAYVRGRLVLSVTARAPAGGLQWGMVGGRLETEAGPSLGRLRALAQDESAAGRFWASWAKRKKEEGDRFPPPLLLIPFLPYERPRLVILSERANGARAKDPPCRAWVLTRASTSSQPWGRFLPLSISAPRTQQPRSPP